MSFPNVHPDEFIQPGPWSTLQNNDEHGMPNPDAPGWKETLASTSEAFVKVGIRPLEEVFFILVLMHQPQADRSGPTSTSELQARTIEFVTERYPSEEHGSSTTASYTHDEVSGPLKSASGCEDDWRNHEMVTKKTKKRVEEKVEESV